MRPIRVLSLFDGMSCGQIALRELRVPIERYYASEVDKFAIQQTQLNFPETVQIGDVRNVDVDRLCEDGEIDLLLAGFPCTDLSLAGKRRGMATTTKEKVTSLSQYLDLRDAGFEFAGQSYLFWEFVRIFKRLRERNPKLLFLLENVEVGKEWDAVVSNTLGLKGVHINAALVSAQNRRRIYWSNVRVREEGMFGWRYTDIPQPTDRGILLRDILEKEVDEKYFLKESTVKFLFKHCEESGFNMNVYDGTKDKSVCLLGSAYKIMIHNQYIQEKNHQSPVCLNKQRNELGRQIRKEYEAGTVKARRSDLVDYAPREDDKTGTITTVQSDNLILSNNHLQKNLTDVDGKANSFLATSHKGAWANGMTLVEKGYRIRRITPTEAARLQTIPGCYHWTCSETQQYRLLGNGWCVEVIKHILSFMNIE